MASSVLGVGGWRRAAPPFVTLNGIVRNRGSRSRTFAVLAHNWTGNESPASSSGQPRRVVVLMHGILGSKSNWNTPAKRILEQIKPHGWHVLQLDHRAHGQSPKGEAPHTLEACAADVCSTLDAVGVAPDDELVVCGHSFGGKVALTFAQARLKAGQRPPRMTWLFDSIPGQPTEQSLDEQRREQSVSFVLAAVEGAAKRGVYAERAALVDVLIEEHGLVKPLAQWVAQSVRNVPGGIEIAYDMAVVRALYDAYRSTDMWKVLEDGFTDVGVVVAGRNKHAWGPENLARLERCGNHVRVATLQNAGHNVHVDDLSGLLDALRPTFT